LEREQSGEGQKVETSLLQAQIFMLDFQASRWLNAGEVPKQAGNNHPTSIPTGVFKTRDGYINIATAGQTTWQRLCNAIGAEQLLKDPLYEGAAARSKNRDALQVELDKILLHDDSRSWIEKLNKAGVPTGPIYAMDEVFADPQVKHLAVVADIPRQGKQDLHVLAQPMTLSRTPSAYVAPPPERGQHNDEVLREFGFAAGEIDELRRKGAL
jgi:crotonobetainyl-CoA:carnitine CoA-transferase CaiB-like acyl-CoA transferase